MASMMRGVVAPRGGDQIGDILAVIGAMKRETVDEAALGSRGSRAELEKLWSMTDTVIH